MASLPDESEQISTSIIKSDRMGRAHYSQEYRVEVLASFDKSCLSGPAFARQCGIKYPTFASWVTKRRQSLVSPNSPDLTSTFIIAELSDRVSDGEGLQVRLPAGAVLTVASPHQVTLAAELIKALA